MRSFAGRQRRNQPIAEDQAHIPLREVNWGRLFGYLRPYKARMALAILALVLSTGAGLAFPLIIVQLLDSVTSSGSMSSLNLLALLLIGIFFAQAAFRFLQSYMLSYVGEHIVYDLRSSLYAHLQRLPLGFHAERRVGDLVSRISNDVTQMRTMLTNDLTMALSQALTLLGSVAILLSMNARFALFILGIAPLLILVAFVFGRRIRRSSTDIQDQLAGATVVAEEGLQGIRIVKSFGREQYEAQRYDGALEKTFRASLKMAIYNSLFAAVLIFLGFSAIAAIMWYGGREVIEGRLNLAMITGFLIYGISIAASLGGLGGLYGAISAAVGGVQRVFELLDTEPTLHDAPDAVDLESTAGRITFENVSFSYDEQSTVLHDVSLEIASGEILALVGPSGAGKSTIFNLIPRFYDPTQGRVLIDGRDLRSVTQHSLRRHMAIVPQESLLFGGTVRENILYGRLEASEAEMVAAAMAANAHDFIREFPDGYETIVGERGARLSGGQRQRIAIARAILKDPRILLLDEATSSLDNESESLVQDALSRLMQGRTTVIIAHRLSTIKVADHIAVLDGGRIAEFGTHEQLMALNGIYAHLYAMQFRDSEEDLVALPPAGAP